MWRQRRTRKNESKVQAGQLDGAQTQGEAYQMGATGLRTRNKEFWG